MKETNNSGAGDSNKEQQPESKIPEAVRKTFNAIGSATGTTFNFLRDQYSKAMRYFRYERHVKKGVILELDLSTTQITENRRNVEIPSFMRLSLPQQVTWYNTIIDALETASKDDKVAGILVKLDGVFTRVQGMAVIEQLRQAIINFRKSGKVAVCYCHEFGEAGSTTKMYWFASAFDEIIMNPHGFVTLDGISVTQPFFKHTLEKLGVQVEVGKRKDFKTAGNMFSEEKFTPEHKQQVENLTSEWIQQIMSDISASRKIPMESLHKIMNQGMLTAKESLEMKLVDKLGYRDQVYKRIEELSGSTAQKVEEKAAAQTEQQPNTLFLTRYLDIARSIEPASDPSNVVAVLTCHGNVRVSAGADDGSSAIFGENVARTLRGLLQKKNVKAIVLHISSSGGSPIGASLIVREIIRAKEKGIPVIVSMGTVAASAGYMVSMHADKIFASSSTITGSIGVIGMKPNFKELLTQFGVSFDGIKTHDNADMFSVIKEFSPEQKQKFEKVLDYWYNEFVSEVAVARKMDKERVEGLAQGKVYTGRQAKELGLVDEVGGLPEAIEAAIKVAKLDKSKTTLMCFPRRRSPLRAILNPAKNDSQKDNLFTEHHQLPTTQALQQIQTLTSLSKSAHQLFSFVDEKMTPAAVGGSVSQGFKVEASMPDLMQTSTSSFKPVQTMFRKVAANTKPQTRAFVTLAYRTIRKAL